MRIRASLLTFFGGVLATTSAETEARVPLSFNACGGGFTTMTQVNS